METYPEVHNASCGQDDDLATLQVSKSYLLLLYQPSVAIKIADLGRVAPLLYQLDINKARPGYMPDCDTVIERDDSSTVPNPTTYHADSEENSHRNHLPPRMNEGSALPKKTNKLDANEMQTRSEAAFRSEK